MMTKQELFQHILNLIRELAIPINPQNLHEVGELMDLLETIGLEAQGQVDVLEANSPESLEGESPE